MLGNIGPGLGSFGPFTNYSDMPSTGKWILCGLMLIGTAGIAYCYSIVYEEFLAAGRDNKKD